MPSLWKRDDTSPDNGGLGEDLGDGGQYDGYDGDGGSWWWSPTGMAIRYTIIILIFASLVLFFLGGYYHAQRRLRKGLPPLPYHAWMVRRRQPRYNYYQQPHPYYQHPGPQQAYAMHENEPPLPPPPYMAPPPAYAPPAGASKAMADQTFHPVERSGEASLPPLPPAARQ
ncbi:hypothetical protein PRZ48_009328 [Zasmidium cellare]|uniref:Uncharacterized protein n=1 Tax=Zasmidium cellare TaxID=395010 RepID=A0ABR0ECM3_ZASCE|nr:hypothetical protein PRZ48_009328 [Zasmidium cellare]